MKVLTLCLSPNKGGLELYACKTIEYYRGNNITSLAVIRPGGFIESVLIKTGIEFSRIKPWVKRLPLFSALRLARLIVTREVDVIHIHWNKDLVLAVFAIVFSRKKVSLVYSRHMGITRNKKDFYHRFLYKHVTSLITHTNLMRQEARNCLPVSADRIKMVYLGTPVVDVLSTKEKDIFLNGTGLDKAKLKLGLFGRIEHGKGQHLLVEALNNLNKADCNIAAGFVGHVMDEKYRINLAQTIKRYKLEEQTHFFGFIDCSARYMKCFDAIILTTYCETFGLVLIEAMRAGVMVIGANAGGVPEIINHNKTGLLFETGNADSLTEVLRTLYANPDLQNQLAEAGKSLADEKFSDKRHLESLMSIIV